MCEREEKVKREKEGKGTGQDRTGPRMVPREGGARSDSNRREGEKRWGMMIVGQAASTE